MVETIRSWWSCAADAVSRVPDAISGIDLAHLGDLKVSDFLRASGPGGAAALAVFLVGLLWALWRLPRTSQVFLSPGKIAFLSGLLALLVGAIGTFAALLAEAYRARPGAEQVAVEGPTDPTLAFLPAMEGAVLFAGAFLAGILFFRLRRSIARRERTDLVA